MLNVGAIEPRDLFWITLKQARRWHIRDLKLDKLDCCVAIIKNARSNKMGKKDIIKVECPVDMMNLDILGFIDHNITVQYHFRRENRGKEAAEAAEAGGECDPLQKSPLHYLH